MTKNACQNNGKAKLDPVVTVEHFYMLNARIQIHQSSTDFKCDKKLGKKIFPDDNIVFTGIHFTRNLKLCILSRSTAQQNWVFQETNCLNINLHRFHFSAGQQKQSDIKGVQLT